MALYVFDLCAGKNKFRFETLFERHNKTPKKTNEQYLQMPTWFSERQSSGKPLEELPLSPLIQI